MLDPTDPDLISSDIARHYFAARFLAREAKLLDERRFDEWAAMVHEDVVYEVALRQAKMEYSEEFVEGAFRLSDTKGIIQLRIERLRSGYAWAETPPSRTLRIVGSILVEETGNQNDIAVDSALIIYRQRGNASPGDVIPFRRSDIIRITNDGGRLMSRRAVMPDTVLQTPNLGIFI